MAKQMHDTGWFGLARQEVYGLVGLLVGALGLWGMYVPTFLFPFWGDAPEMVFVAKNQFLPHGPYPVYVWLGRLCGYLGAPAGGLSAVSLLFGLIGLAGFVYVVLKLTDDRVQALFCGILFVLTPVVLRQNVVQEIASVQAGVLMAALAVLLSTQDRRFVISGALFGCAVGIHPASLFTLPAFLFWIYRHANPKELALQAWGKAAGMVCALAWLWLLFRFGQARLGTESWFGYMLGGIGRGYEGLTLATWIPRLTFYLDVQAYLLGWVGAVLGLTGLVLMGFLYRDRFYLLVLYGVPFVLYQIPRAISVDEGLYLAFLAPVYILALGTVWRAGSAYLAEGLQEPLKGMYWVVAVGIVLGQVLGLAYADNYFLNALKRRERHANALHEVQAMGEQIRAHTHPEDLVVVIPDPRRPGSLGVAQTPWAIAYHVDRQVVFGEPDSTGIVFHTVPWNRDRWGWTRSRVLAGGAFIEQVYRQGRRLFSTEPFPFLHAENVKGWVAATPDLRFGETLFFELFSALERQIDPVDSYADHFLAVYDIYVQRGYWADAAASLEGAIEHQPNNTGLLRKVGDLYMKMEAFKRASEIYGRLVALTPDEEEAVANLSGAYYSLGNLDRAIQICLDFLSRHSEAAHTIYNLAGYYEKTGKSAQAKQAYQKYLKVGDVESYLEKARGMIKKLETL